MFDINIFRVYYFIKPIFEPDLFIARWGEGMLMANGQDEKYNQPEEQQPGHEKRQVQIPVISLSRGGGFNKGIDEKSAAGDIKIIFNTQIISAIDITIQIKKDPPPYTRKMKSDEIIWGEM